MFFDAEDSLEYDETLGGLTVNHMNIDDDNL